MLKVALMYDFDKTLSTKDMQEFDFIKNLKMDAGEFWSKVESQTKTNEADKILSYMYMMISEAKSRNINVTKEYLAKCGSSVELYPGVLDWFLRINQYAANLGIELEHYIISSGVTEMIMGTPIAKYFKKIYASSFMYDDNGNAIWPNTAVNYTQKTQYLFRIAKGAFDLLDDDTVNKKAEELRIEYSNMIYFGDGITDIPCMKLVKDKGGYSIAIYKKGKEEKIKNLLDDDRVSIACPADYSEGSPLDKAVKYMIVNMNSNHLLEKIERDALNAASK